MILVSMDRGDPTLYYGINQLYFGRVNFKYTGVVTTPPREDVLQKRLRKTRVNVNKYSFPMQEVCFFFVFVFFLFVCLFVCLFFCLLLFCFVFW